MNIEKFIQSVSSSIVARGECYYFDESVKNLEYLDNGYWKAEVYGTDCYDVSIQFEGPDVKEWLCDCPYDQGPVCKHVVAVLMEISDEKGESESKVSEGGSEKKMVIEILNKISKEDLVKFIKKNADESFINILFDNYCHLIKIEPESKYRQIIRGYINTALNEDGFIGYHQAYAAMSPIVVLTNKAEKLIKNRKYKEAIIICKTVIEEVTEIIEDIDDSDGWINDTAGHAFSLLEHLGQSTRSEKLKKELFEYCLNEYKKEKYEGYFDNNFIEILKYCVTGSDDEEKCLKIISDKIDKAEDEWDSINFIEIKVDFLKSFKRDSEADKLIEDNSKYDTFRKMLVEKEIKNKNYDRTISLVNEGIKINADRWQRSGWKDYLLKIAELKKDKKEALKISREQFLSSYNFEYYSKIK